jgi:hypothetical protein
MLAQETFDHVVVADAAVVAIAHGQLAEQVVLVQRPVRAVGPDPCGRAPAVRQAEAVIGGGDVGDGAVEVLLRDVALVDPDEPPPALAGRTVLLGDAPVVLRALYC